MTRTDQDFKSRLINMLKVVQTVKDLPEMQETQVLSLVQEDTLEQGMISLSSIAWRVLWSEGWSWDRKELHVTNRLTLSLSKEIKANITNMTPE